MEINIHVWQKAAYFFFIPKLIIKESECTLVGMLKLTAYVMTEIYLYYAKVNEMPI